MSWAIPKGPSMTTSEKRLAVAVDDHDLSYADYEGVIPEGSYGAGPVMVWDRGTYRDISPAGWETGRIEVELSGTKLVGKFALIRMKGRGEIKLVPHEDEGRQAAGRRHPRRQPPTPPRPAGPWKQIAAESPTAPPCEVKE